MWPHQRQAFRDCENRGSEKGVEKPIAALPQQIARGHGVPPAETRLGNPINGGEAGRQDPGGRDEHPWSKALRDSHLVKVLQARLGGKGSEYAQTIDDRSRQQTRRSRIPSCRVTSHGVVCAISTELLSKLLEATPMILRISISSLLSLILGAALFAAAKPAASFVAKEETVEIQDNRASDAAAIRAHIESIFQAFI